jgi:hypothetical protein
VLRCSTLRAAARRQDTVELVPVASAAPSVGGSLHYGRGRASDTTNSEQQTPEYPFITTIANDRPSPQRISPFTDQSHCVRNTVM